MQLEKNKAMKDIVLTITFLITLSEANVFNQSNTIT